MITQVIEMIVVIVLFALMPDWFVSKAWEVLCFVLVVYIPLCLALRVQLWGAFIAFLVLVSVWLLLLLLMAVRTRTRKWMSASWSYPIGLNWNVYTGYY